MISSTSSAPSAYTSSIWFKIWRPVDTTVFCQLGVFLKVIMGVVNTFETCGVLEIKVTSWPIPIWYGVKGTLVDMNSKYYNLLSSMVNERLTSSTCSLLNLSLPSTGWLTTMVTGTCIIKVWIGKGMIFKHVPPLSGLTGLITGCTIDGVSRILLLIPITIDTKLKGLYLKSRKQFDKLAAQVDNFVHQSELTPYCPKFVLLWILEQFATPSTWGFCFPRLGFTL